MSARRHPLPILLAIPRSIPPQQLATLPDLFRNHTARIIIVASRPAPRRNLLALPFQFVRPLLSNRAITGPSMPMLFTVSFTSARRHKVRPTSVVHPNPPLVGPHEYPSWHAAPLRCFTSCTPPRTSSGQKF